MRILIKNGRVITKNKELIGYDILIDNDKIVSVAKSINNSADEIIDATGKVVFTGFVDMHTHLREPGLEYKETIESGTRAAASGGYAAVCCMPNTNPVCDNISTVEFILQKGAKAGYSRVYPIGSITKGLKGEELSEMARMKNAGIVAVSDDGCPVSNGNVMRNAIEYAKGHDILVISHCEDKDIVCGGVVNEGYNSTYTGLRGINRTAEEVMVAREGALSETLDARVHIAHASTEGSVAIIKFYKERGARLTAETCPHYFSLTDDEILTFDTASKVNPPLREEKDRLAIIKGLQDGSLDVIATDHAPHHIDDKMVEYNSAAFGISGIETAYAVSNTYLVKEGHIDNVKLNNLMSLRPREILGFDSNGISEGAIADVTICDDKYQFVCDSSKFLSKGHNTPFNGKTLFGKVLYTIIGGKIVVKNGEII